MKILYHHRIMSKDGQYVHIEELTNALRKMGHEIIMVGPSQMEDGTFGFDGGIVKSLKRHIPKIVYEVVEFFYSLHAYRKLKRAIRRHRPDIIYERYNIFMPAGIWAKNKYRLPLVLEVNAPLYDERSKFGGIALKRLARWTERYCWNNADHVLPVTEVLAQRVLKEGVSREHLTVIHNGIDPDKFSDQLPIAEAKAALGLPDKLILGFTGFMREWHGLDQVVDLLAGEKHGDRFLLLVGDGPAREAIVERANRLQVSDRVLITGVVSRDQIAKYVAAFDIALQPNVVEYASPLKLFEYMALGRAIVAPDKKNIREILTHEKNAFLFGSRTEYTFREAIERICSDSTTRNTLMRNAKSTIRERGYTWENNALRVTSIMERLAR